MKVYSGQFQITSNGYCDIIDISDKVRQIVRESGLEDGIACVNIAGSTAGITTIEYESGCIEDLQRTIRELVPEDRHYKHNERWGDGNGFSHVRAALFGGSYSVPFQGQVLLLGTWQQLVLLDFDNRERVRNIIVQLVGE